MSLCLHHAPDEPLALRAAHKSYKKQMTTTQKRNYSPTNLCKLRVFEWFERISISPINIHPYYFLKKLLLTITATKFRRHILRKLTYQIIMKCASNFLLKMYLSALTFQSFFQTYNFNLLIRLYII